MTSKAWLRLSTYGIYHGIAACRIETMIDGEHWRHWGVQDVIAEDWYFFNLFCLLNLADGVVLEGADKLQEWRSSLKVENANGDVAETATV